MIIFNEEAHSYKYEGEEFVSVTRIIKSLEQEKDWDSIAEKYAKKNSLLKEDVLKMWEEKGKEAVKKGTLYHKSREIEMIENGAFPIIEVDGNKKAYDLRKLEAGVYPELILYMMSHKICGTSDKVIVNEDKTFEVVDFKTNSKLRSSGELEAYWNPVKKVKEKEKLLSPVSHLYNCEIDKYTLQLSCYAYMLEQYGFSCKSLSIEHILFNEDDTYKESKIIPIPYLKKEAKSVLDWYYRKNIKKT